MEKKKKITIAVQFRVPSPHFCPTPDLSDSSTRKAQLLHGQTEGEMFSGHQRELAAQQVEGTGSGLCAGEGVRQRRWKNQACNYGWGEHTQSA